MGYCGDRSGAALTPLRLIERAIEQVPQGGAACTNKIAWSRTRSLKKLQVESSVKLRLQTLANG